MGEGIWMLCKRIHALGWAFAVWVAAGSPLPAAGQDWDDDYGYDEPDPYRSPPKSGGTSVRAAFGFTADPEAFEMGLSFPIELTDGVAFTPHLLLAFDEEDTIVAPTANIEVYSRLSDDRNDDFRYRMRPYLQVGLGFAYIDRESASDNNNEVGLLIAPGLGVEYEISDSLSIGTNARFNVLPKKTGGEHFFFSWEFLTLRIAF
jgi:hypothetical protein